MKQPSARFWNLIARRYAKSPVADETAYQRKLDITRQYLDKHHQVLEFGCGTGSTAVAHAPFVGHYLATDFSSRMIEIAREKARAAGVTNVSFEVATLDQLDLEDNSMDVVMAHSILHLLPDWKGAIEQSWRLLKPGGVFVTSTTCMSDVPGAVRLILRAGGSIRLLPKLQIFSPDQLRHSISECGFTIMEDWQPAPKAALFLVARKPEA